jgi:hypothetical protein
MVTKLAIRLGVPAFPNDPLRFTGSVTGKSAGADGEGFVEIAFKGSNSLGDHVSGTATISLLERTRDAKEQGRTRGAIEQDDKLA